MLDEQDEQRLLEGLVFVFPLALLLTSFVLLIHMVRGFAVPRHKYFKPDPLFKSWQNGQNWSWDWIMVFRVQEADDVVTRYQEQYSLRRIVERLNAGGLETKLYLSYDYSKIFCKIRSSKERLCLAAAATDYQLMLDEEEVKKRLARGYYTEQHKLLWKGRKIVDTKGQSSYKYYEYIYGKYVKSKDEPYRKYHLSNSIFRGVDRLKLMMSIMEADLKQEGCSLVARELVVKGACLAVYPLHDELELHALMNAWLAYFSMPWDQPIVAIRDYFGEKVGMYFLFLGFYASWLLVAAVFGVSAYIAPSVSTRAAVYASSVVTVVMSLWATCFLQAWRARQATTKMEWGMASFELLERERTGFVGKVIHSPVTGLPDLYFPERVKIARIISSYLQIALCLLYVATINAGVFYSQAYLSRFPYQKLFAFAFFPKRYNLPQIMTHVTLAAIIELTNRVFMPLATYLNTVENHRTETQYEDNLIAKVFVFQFVNSYGALFYIGFIQGPLAETLALVEPWKTRRFDCRPFCFRTVGALLATIMLMRVVVKNVSEVIIPFIVARQRMLHKSLLQASGQARPDADEYEDPHDGDVMRKRQVSPAEEQFEKKSYEAINLFNDYAELAIQFGYTTLFVSAFPLAPLFACANNLIAIRVDGWKLTQTMRRPWPAGAEDIGIWEDVISVIAMLATISNAALVTLNSPFLETRPLWERVIIFIAIEFLLVGIQLGLSAYLDDIPGDVQIQYDRQEYYASKIIMNLRDEEENADDDSDKTDEFQEPVVFQSDPQIKNQAETKVSDDASADTKNGHHKDK